MTDDLPEYGGKFPYEFSFESYGVAVDIKCDSRELLEEFRSLIHATMIGRLKPLKSGENPADLEFKFAIDKNNYFFCYENGKLRAEPASYIGNLNFYESYLRIKIAEYAPNDVFVHAGVVAWNDLAIVIPGSSYSGKSTLVVELVKLGAEYFSDEYAIFDREGFVHPFPRPLQIRKEGRYDQTQVSVEELGGVAADQKLPVGLIVITKYEPDSVWKPETISTGEAVVEMVPHTIAIRKNTNFSLNVLKTAAERAIIVRGRRNEASDFAKTLIDLLERNN